MIYRRNRAVILDLDGVVAPFGRLNPAVLDAACVRRVHALAQDANIVLSSSWPMAEAEDALRLRLDHVLPFERRNVCERPGLIQQWLDTNKQETEWVSLDDEPFIMHARWRYDRSQQRLDDEFILAHSSRFLLTTWSIFGDKGEGLSDSLLTKVFGLLKAPEGRLPGGSR